MKALVPEGFQLSRHVSNYPPTQFGFDVSGRKAFNPDHALYLLSQISLVPVRNKEIADGMKEGYTPLYSKLLQKTVYHYAFYMRYFIDTGVIETNGRYRPSIFFPGEGQCRGYRFRARYCQGQASQAPYSAKFLNVLTRKRRADYAALRREYGHLTKWLWPTCRLRIDAKVAMDFLDVRYKAQQARPALRDTRKHPIYGTLEEKDPLTQFKHAKANVDCLTSQDVGCTVDPTVGRMHTVLTNMKSDLRNLVTFDGRPLASIDIANSQPYLSTILFNPKIYKSCGPASQPTSQKLKIERINPQIQKEINQHPLMLSKISQLFDSEDFKLYQSLVSAKNGRTEDLYTYMNEQSERILGFKFDSRTELKVGMFEVLFSRNKYPGKSGVKKLFKNIFPSVDELFRLLKEGNHARLPCLLQSIESYVMLKVITKKIAQLYPEIPLFTIHDSIATTVDHVATVGTIMRDELTRLIGLPPKLKIEEWKPANLDWAKYQIPVRKVA